jgi:hypothetical protein
MQINSIPDKSNDGCLIVVLGMHRSGTSAITRAMETLGAELGLRLFPGAAGINDKGYFEDIDIHSLNVELMSIAGMDWHAMAEINLNTIDRQVLDELQTKAISLLRKKSAGKTLALKDPRIARLLPFWQPVFACLNVRTRYVIALRNPISVAQSLSKRDGFPHEKSYLLWLAHMVPALLSTRDCERVLLSYDRLMDSPGRELARIAAHLGLELDSERLNVLEEEFLDDGLRHSRFAALDLEVVRSAPRQVKELFSALEIASLDTNSANAVRLDAAIAGAQRYLEEIAPLLRYEWQVDRQTQKLQQTLTEYARRSEDLTSIIQDREIAAETAHLHTQQLTAENANHREKIQTLEQRIEQLLSDQFASQEKFQALEQRIEQLLGDQFVSQETIQALERRIEQLLGDQFAPQEKLHALEQRAQDLTEANAAREDSLRSLEERVAQLVRENASQRGTIQSLEQNAIFQAAELLRSEEAVARILESTSWRLTAPFRAIRRCVSFRFA